MSFSCKKKNVRYYFMPVKKSQALACASDKLKCKLDKLEKKTAQNSWILKTPFFDNVKIEAYI